MNTNNPYVRLHSDLFAHRGTIHYQTIDGQTRTVFRIDPRFSLKLEDIPVNVGDYIDCPRPVDEEVVNINAHLRKRELT